MIIEVSDQNLPVAAQIHSISWCDSHRAFCSPEFVALHSVGHQLEYLRGEKRAGKRIYMLLAPEPVGIVSVKASLIENLYILPREQHNGYGSQLLAFAVSKCTGTPTLWLLDNNTGAYALYLRRGFVPTGKVHRLSTTITELEMELRNSMKQEEIP